tara:strand:- start:595 stop:3084 length:2490 start_codon:yes stop_codon:yes gene_type:complete
MAHLIVRNKLGTEQESLSITGSLLTYLRESVPGYQALCRPPYSATLNGHPWPYARHGERLTDEDVVEVTIEPGDAATAFAIIAVVAAGYAYVKASNIPQNYQTSTPAGESIYSPNGKANRVRPNGIIREVAGSVPIYPDLICPVRRKYDSNLEYLYLNLCVGAGEFDLTTSDLYIAETPMLNYAGDISVQITPPGGDVSTHDAHENWFTTEEISDLKLVTSTDSEAGTWSIDASGDQMTSYEAGSLVAFPFAVGAYFEITNSTNAGTYRVDSISGASNETATVVKQVVTRYWDGDGEDPRYSQGSYVTEYEDASSTNLTTTTGEVVDWGATSGGVNWEGPFEILPQGETTDVMEVDFRFPRGLAKTENDGSLTARTVDVKVAYREVGTSTWTELDYSYTDNTLDELGFTESITLPATMRPEVRVRRVTADAAATNIINDIYCVRIRGRLESPTSYADVTTVQLRLRGTNALAQTAENKINIRGATRKLPTVEALKEYIQDGTPYSLTASHGGSSLAPYFAWTLYDVSRADLLDWEEIAKLDATLKGRGDELNAEFVDEATLWESIKIILAPGYAQATIKEGLLSPVRREASTEYQQFYPPDVMLGAGLSRDDTHYDASEPKGLVVEYLNPVTGTNDTVNCFIAGDSEAQAKRIQATGITDRTRAWRYGMRERLRLAYKPARIEFTTELDALNSDYGNYDAVASPLNANQSFYVTDYSAPTITLDSAPDLSGGLTYYAAFRQPNGAFSGLYVIAAGSTSDEITLSSPATLDFTPVYDGSMEDTICVIGTADELIERVWIDSISPGSDDTVTVTGEEYIAAIFEYDNSTPD